MYFLFHSQTDEIEDMKRACVLSKFFSITDSDKLQILSRIQIRLVGIYDCYRIIKHLYQILLKLRCESRFFQPSKIKDRHENILFYKLNSMPGTSDSPYLYESGNNYFMVGIHAGCIDTLLDLGSSFLFTPKIIKEIQSEIENLHSMQD